MKSHIDLLRERVARLDRLNNDDVHWIKGVPIPEPQTVIKEVLIGILDELTRLELGIDSADL
jgi:hypothetical protein